MTKGTFIIIWKIFFCQYNKYSKNSHRLSSTIQIAYKALTTERMVLSQYKPWQYRFSGLTIIYIRVIYSWTLLPLIYKYHVFRVSFSY